MGLVVGKNKYSLDCTYLLSLCNFPTLVHQHFNNFLC